MDFKELYDKAFAVSFESYETKDCEIGSVGCAILTDTGHVYVGKNLDMSCSLGFCAERNAISTMLTNETAKIVKLACVHKSGAIITPCGACREFMKQLGDLCYDMEILVSLDPYQTIMLKDLLPLWWRDEILKSKKQH